MSSKVEDFLTAAQEQEIVQAIRDAELRTSGEIRVHLESNCSGDVYERAQELFHVLKMDNTRDANGILFYVAVDDRKFALLGDTGIHAVVGAQFWIDVKNEMELRFRESKFTQGLTAAIQLVGERLSAHFPWDEDDVNELPDQISTS
ncbi:TPM domain-containing protein [Nonlabens ponticola]|uniref:TPM domain-containing protein n=1 Tax=Nonlabens ponticola TaxID=2496866 RepID=A0A3S9MXS4_9FLAO|nr:TPM domain-containing protein [Nonlabens ponticola]AZQ43938.1 TPM domain-containing protein [Nonlabens ponticola]